MIGKNIIANHCFVCCSALFLLLSQQQILDLIVAIATGLAIYRFGLPMTIRSTFYPIIGDYCWGWIGDVIDGYSIVMTVAGVCTSLGLGTIQMIGKSRC